MKKSIAIAALTIGATILGTNNVQAQNATATTTVNITLKDVISIDAGSTAIGNTVDLTMLLQQTITLIKQLLKLTL
ncbi:exported hypothetical protein [Chryseobacterium sp. 8AT]|nr:exported hypothetical protein [Chryseobacterium sp. 8AT]